MRRLYSYILLAITSLLLVGTTFSLAVKRTDSNIEYSQGRELVFRLSEKDEEGHAELNSVEDAKAIADVMAERLELSNVSRYKIDIEGKETIKLTVGSDVNYQNLVEFMCFDGSFAIATSNSEHLHESVQAFGEDGFLVDADGNRLSKAYLTTAGGAYPQVVLPINTESSQYKLIYDWAKEEGKAEKESTGSSEEGEGESYYYLYLWYHYNSEECTYTEYKSNEHGFASRMLMKFPIFDNPEQQYLNGENELYWTFNIGEGSTSEKESAFTNARFLVNLLNADVLDFDVTAISTSNYTSAWYESLISYETNIAQVKMSRTLLSTLCAIIVVSLLLVIYFRLAALAIASMSIASVYAGYWAMIGLGATFNTFTIFGLILVAIASLASGIVLMSKIKNECYRGRSLKKANTEGSKKALLPILDINIVAIIIGVFCYIFGGALIRSFAAVTVIGGLASLLLNILGTRGLVWLLTNTTGLQGKYGVIGVDSSKVPNILKEEKQNYFGPYEGKDFTKKKKPASIIALALLVASTACIVTFGILGGGNIYVNKTYSKGTNMYFEEVLENVENTIYSEDIISDYLATIYTYNENVNDGTSLKDRISGTPVEWENPYTTYDADEEENISHYIYFVEFDSYIDQSSKAVYLENYSKLTFTHVAGQSDIATAPAGNDFVQYYFDGKLLNEVPTSTSEAGEYTLVSGLVSIDDTLDVVVANSFTMEFVNNDATVLLNTVENYKVGQINALKIFLGVGIASLVIGAYLMLRYRLSRGLAALIAGVGTATIAVGLFAMIRVGIDAYVVAAAPVALLFVMALCIFFFSRERELVLEDKTRDVSKENRGVIMNKALAGTYDDIKLLMFIGLLIAVCFAGFGLLSLGVAHATVGILAIGGVLLVAYVVGPVAQFFYGLFLNRPVKERKPRKKAVKKVNKSAEPEEAIFIGIND